MKNSFFLVIPPQETVPEKLKQFEPKALDQWLAELPTANPGLATRLIVDHVTDFNALKADLQFRLNALEQMRPKVLIIEDYLRSRLMSAGFPKSENELKILQVLASLEKEFTIGYWIVLKELTHRQVSWFQGKNLALTLQRCIKGLSSVVISYSMMGLAIPDWVWIDLHSLYKLSVKLKKSDTKVNDSTNSVTKASSPEECYRQILLMHLSRPTGMMQKEIFLVYSFIENLFPFFNFSRTAIESQQMQFITVLDEDKPPHVQIEMHIRRDVAALYIDLTRLIKAIENKDKFASQQQTRFSSMHILKNHEEKPTAELIAYLEQRWLGVELQQQAFFGDRLDRYLSIGMASAHSYQNQQAVADKNTDIEPEFLVHSESDRLLFCTFDKPGALTVGNLVSFRKADQPIHKRSLAVVNELIVAKQSGKISFGLSVLTNHYSAVYYMVTNSSDSDTILKGLFYNADDEVVEASFLVVDNFMLKEGDVIKMQLNQEKIFLTLKGKTNIGLGYWQFECQRIAANSNKINKPESKKGYDFI